MPKNVARGTLLGIAGQGWQLVTALLLYAYLARRFGVAAFGGWTVVLSVLAWFEILVVAGVAKVVTKTTSERPADALPLARAGYLAQGGVALAAFALMELGAGPIAAALGNPALEPLVRIAALDIPAFAALMLASAVVLGLHRFERQASAWIVYATAKAVLVALLATVGFSVAGALVGNALASLVGFAAAWLPPRRIAAAAQAEDASDTATAVPGTDGAPTRASALAGWMLAAAVPFLTLALVEGLGQSVDLWIVSATTASRELVGYYAVATMLAEIPVFLFLGLNRVIFPSVARAEAEGDGERSAHYVTQAVRLATLVTALGVGLVAALGRPLVAIVYGTNYLGAYVPVVLLMAAGMGRAIRATCTEVLMAQNRRRAALAVLIGTVLLEIALAAVGSIRFGIAGAAAGTAISALVAAVWGGILLRRSLGARPLATLARSVLAAALVALALTAVAPSPNGGVAMLLVTTLGLLIAGVAVYGAALWALREFSAADVATVRSLAGGGGR